jgi:hypothetical protein
LLFSSSKRRKIGRKFFPCEKKTMEDEWEDLFQEYIQLQEEMFHDFIHPPAHIPLVLKKIYKVKGRDEFVYQSASTTSPVPLLKWIKCSLPQKNLMKQGKLIACEGPWCTAYLNPNGKKKISLNQSECGPNWVFDDHYYLKQGPFENWYITAQQKRQVYPINPPSQELPELPEFPEWKKERQEAQETEGSDYNDYSDYETEYVPDLLPEPLSEPLPEPSPEPFTQPTRRYISLDDL